MRIFLASSLLADCALLPGAIPARSPRTARTRIRRNHGVSPARESCFDRRRTRNRGGGSRGHSGLHGCDDDALPAQGSERGQRAASGRHDHRGRAGVEECRRDGGAGSHCCDRAGQAGLQADGVLSRAGAGRRGSGLQAAQPGRARDSSRAVSRQDAAADLYLHALPAAELLPAGDAQLCRDRSPIWPRIRRSMPKRTCCA